MTFRWTETNIEKATTLWGSGLSMSQIAKEVGTSKDSVSSKLSRIRSTGKDVRPGQMGVPKTFVKPLTRKPVEIQKPTSAMAFVLGAPKSVSFKEPKLDEYEMGRLPGLSLVDNTGCMYPLTAVGPHMFCGCDRVELGRYCEYHAEKCSNGITGESRWYKQIVKGVE